MESKAGGGCRGAVGVHVPHSAGAVVFMPLFEHLDYDLIADFGDRLERVQVKPFVHPPGWPEVRRV